MRYTKPADYFRVLRRKCRFRIGAPHVNLYNRYPSIRQAKKAWLRKPTRPAEVNGGQSLQQQGLALVEGRKSTEGYVNAKRRRKLRRPVKFWLDDPIMSTAQIRTVFLHEQPWRIHRD